MAVETLHTISFAELPAQIRKLGVTFNAAEFKKGFIDPAAEQMKKETQEQFETGVDPTGRRWLSNAFQRKFGNRWSIEYIKRPSGNILNPGHIRLRDTGQLRDSFKITKLSSSHITVAPTGTHTGRYGSFANLDLALVAYDNWKNSLVGWTEERIKKLNAKLEEYLRKKATQ